MYMDGPSRRDQSRSVGLALTLPARHDGMLRSAFAKFSATWLTLLTLSPFTAPFAPCDFTRTSDRAAASTTAHADTSATPLLSRAAAARRVRLLASSPCVALKFCAAPLSGSPVPAVAPSRTTPPPGSPAILRI
jgi:hypothetical protein